MLECYVGNIKFYKNLMSSNLYKKNMQGHVHYLNRELSSSDFHEIEVEKMWQLDRIDEHSYSSQ